MQANDADRARDALHSMPADCDRATWVKTGMAFHAAGGGLEDWDAWSAQAPSYNGQACRATWRSFKTAPGGVGAGALFGMARDHGWIDGTASPYEAPAKVPARAKRPVEPPRKPAPGQSASELFGRFEAATNGHAYIVAKGAAGVPLDALRVVPAGDTLTQYRGWLAVPGYGPDGQLQTIEFIGGDGTKRTLKDSTKSGAFFAVGSADAVPVYVCEGIGQAWACWQATGAAAVACFGWGNVRRVAAELRARDPSARLVICPDVGKEDDAQKIAAEIGAAVAAMPAGEANNFDANDLMQRDGLDVLELLLSSASEPRKPEPLLKPVSVFDLFTRPSPPPEFAWESYCPLDEVTLFAANGGTGKSVIGLMLAVSVALGRPLFDVPTKPGRVLFASLEDGADLVRHRLTGICRAWQVDPVQLHGRLTVVDGTEHPELFTVENHSAGDVTTSYAEMRRFAEGATLVLIDNASDAFGGDEIKRREVRSFVRVLKAIAKAEHCAVVLLAHVNAMTARARKPDNDEGYSGSTAWNNSVRSRLFLSRDELGLLTLAHQKANLSKRREPIALQWLDEGLPELVQAGPGFDGINQRQQGHADDTRASELLRLVAEFEGRGQYASPSPTARNNVHNLLKSEPAFVTLKLRPDDTKRITNQCQRAGWLVSLDYRSKHTNKTCQRWAVAPEGRLFAGISAETPTAPTAPTYHVGNEGEQGANGGAPTAPTCAGGYGGNSAPTFGTKDGVCND